MYVTACIVARWIERVCDDTNSLKLADTKRVVVKKGEEGRRSEERIFDLLYFRRIFNPFLKHLDAQLII